MKSKFTFIVFTALAVISSFFSPAVSGQKALKIDFQMQYNDELESVDSVRIYNASQAKREGLFEYPSTVLKYPDTSLVLHEYPDAINETTLDTKNRPGLSCNYPNPFAEQTYFNIYLPQSTGIKLIVSDITGRKLTEQSYTLCEGTHRFVFYTGSENIYIVSLLTDKDISSIKMISDGTNTNKIPMLEYQGNTKNNSAFAANSANLKSVQSDFSFQPGDTLIYYGYTTHSYIYNNTITDNPLISKTYTFETEWGYLDNPLAGLALVYNTFYHEGSYMRAHSLAMDVRADDAQHSCEWTSISNLDSYIDSIGNQLLYGSWANNFNGIKRTNQVIKYLPDIDMDSSLKSRIIGEALFLRGLFYYNLLNLFYTVPLNIKDATEYSEYYLPVSARNDVWAQVISDFTEASEKLPYKYTQPEDIGRATKGAALGFLGKTYMINKQWSNAASTLGSVINSFSYALVPDYRDNFTLANENNSESVFEIQYDKDLGGTTRGWGYTEVINDLDKTTAKANDYAPIPYGWGNVAPTDWIYEEFILEKTTDGKNDPRLDASLWYSGNDTTIYSDTAKRVSDLSFSTPVTMKNKIFIRKYLNKTSEPEMEWRSEINERILRYADILLLYAEAQNELGNTFDAYQYIQMVRSRSNLPDLTPGMTQAQMREQIYHERALEFCFEGIRYTDLLRWGWFEDPARLDTLKSRDSSYNAYSTGREYLPIPTEILNENPFLTQSMGW